MKKQKLSELAKSKGVYAVLLVGVFVVVTAVLISINKQPGQQQENNNLVDLNEDPLDVAQNGELDQSAAPNKVEVDDHVDTSEPDDRLYEDYTERDRPSTLPGGVEVGGTTDNGVANGNENQTTANTDVATNENVVEEVKPVISTTKPSLSFSPDKGLAWPIDGNVIKNYSADRTVYHETLMQFKTNPAILIQGEIGSEVVASAKGIISSIENDPQTGLTITMDIGDGYQLVYGQLEETDLKVGKVIEEGQVIGVLAKVSKYYSVEGEHLYFQVLNADATVNPMTLLRDGE